MTVLAVVKTQSDVVIAADSRIAAQGYEGVDPDGRARVGRKTFELATKIVVSRTGGVVAAVAGTVGRWTTPMDFFAARDFAPGSAAAEADDVVAACGELAAIRDEHLAGSAGAWPETLVLLARSRPGGGARLWRLVLRGREPTIEEILPGTGILVEGGADVARLLEGASGGLRAIDRIEVAAMPVQDAVDLAHFLASVQVNMDRFVVGQGSCGGPIDVAVVHGRQPGVVTWLPGKALRHPTDPP